MDEFRLTLRGTGVPDGDLTFAALNRITSAMQQLATRIGRSLIGQEGPGRSPAAVEKATTLRLRGTPQRGSTILDIAIGPEQLLQTDDLEHNTLDQMFLLLDGLAAGAPPEHVSPQLGTAVLQVADALAFSADHCEFASAGRRNITLRPGTVSRSPWPTEPDNSTRAETVVTGHLDLVDLRKARFRLRDAVGNDITLADVLDAHDAAHLVGRQVTAVGEGVIGSRGQITSVNSAQISAAEMPDWPSPLLTLGSASAPSLAGIPGVTDEDIDDFLALIRE